MDSRETECAVATGERTVVPGPVECVGVVGAGQMGAGIAQVAAQAEMRVILKDVAADLLDRALAAIDRSLRRLVEKGRIQPDQVSKTLALVTPTTEDGELRRADFVIEAVPENMSLKRDVFRQLDSVCGGAAVLATNTSSLPITEIAAATHRPDRVIGMHFFNPVPVMQLVEIIRGLATSQETFERTRALAIAMGKTPVQVNDSPGFVSNRILMPMINEAAFCLMEGIASAEDIDTVMRLGMNHPMGPLALADLIGLDTCLSILEALHRGLGDPKYRPCPLLRKMVSAGYLGRKAGRGFYTY